ncbi:hypothetical protein [Microvirga sp. P5_D2]
MSGTSHNPNAQDIEDIARLMTRVVDVGISQRQAEELIDEMSQLLWAISDLDPDAERTLKHSGKFADLVTQVTK